MKNLFWVLILFIVGFLFGFFSDKIFEINQSHPIHIHRVGHIPVPDSLANNGALISDFYIGAYHTHSSASPKIYYGSKYQFRKRILEKFNSSNFTESGYLTLRFFINPKSEVFLYEIIEMDLNLQPTDLNDELVNELKILSFSPINWNPYLDDNYNYYMHLTYRIDNGKVTEIIP